MTRKRRLQLPRPSTPADETNGLPLPAQRVEDILPFGSLAWAKFEQLCAEILENQPGITRVEMKRIEGVAQYGADIEGFDENHATERVISCKRHKRIKKGEIATWIDDFAKYWQAHWRHRGVREFILAVTVQLNNDRLNEEIKASAATLRTLGVTLVVWSARTLTAKLKIDRLAVSRHFNPVWADAICGPPEAMTVGSLPLARQGSGRLAPAEETNTLAAEKHVLTSAYGDSITRNIDDAFEQYRSGNRQPLDELVDTMAREHAAWNTLPEFIKSRVLRVQALLALQDGNPKKAERLMDQAAAFAPPPDRVLATMTRRVTHDAATALRFLAEPLTTKETEAKASLLIEAGQPGDALALLHQRNLSTSSEAHRLQAIALTLLRRPTEALEKIDISERLGPKEFHVRLTAGMVRLAAALSSEAECQFGEVPNPIPLALIREDDASRRYIERAEIDFAALIDWASEPRRSEVEVWRIAALFALPERRVDTVRMVSEMLGRANPHPALVAWGLAIGAEFNHARVRRAFESVLAAGRGTATHLAIAALLSFGNNNSTKALRLLKRYDGMFGAVAGLVGIEGGVVSGVFNLESSGVDALDWRPRHDKSYHEA
jgi:hypothetical protein